VKAINEYFRQSLTNLRVYLFITDVVLYYVSLCVVW